VAEHTARKDAPTASLPSFAGSRLRPVSASIVGKIRDQLTGETDEALMPRFGISYNTWRKVRAGEPIRRSVAERLERRVQGNAERPR
jgi:hypothetical protein